MTSVHSVAPAPKQATSGSSTATAADAAAGDLFAALVAALLPQIQGLTGEGGSDAGTGKATGGDGTATAAAATAGATTGGEVTVDLTALAADATAAAGAGPTDLPAGALALTAADAKAIEGILKALTTQAGSSPAGPVLEALALRRGVTTDTSPSTTTTATTAAAKPGAAAAGTVDPAALNAPVAVTTTNTGTDTNGDTDSDSDSDKAVTAAPAARATAAPAKREEGPAASSALDATPDGVAQPLSVNHRTAVDATAASREAASVAPAEPHQQLASVITPLSQRPDGTYHLALRLHPEHLGAVDVDVQLHQGTIEVHVQTQHAEAREILTNHLDDLRRDLEQAGLRAGTLDVSDRQQPRQPAPGQGQSQFNGQGQRSPVNPRPAASGPATPTTTARPDRPSRLSTADGAVDVDL